MNHSLLACHIAKISASKAFWLQSITVEPLNGGLILGFSLCMAMQLGPR